MATEQAPNPTSVGQMVPARPAPSADVRPVSARRRALSALPDGGREVLAPARATVAGMLQAHAVAPLAALRLRAGLSQQEAAQRTGIKQPHISRLENGQVQTPELPTLRAMANAYGCTLDEVVKALDQSLPGHG